jgi:hypothetical protein
VDVRLIYFASKLRTVGNVPDNLEFLKASLSGHTSADTRSVREAWVLTSSLDFTARKDDDDGLQDCRGAGQNWHLRRCHGSILHDEITHGRQALSAVQSTGQ